MMNKYQGPLALLFACLTGIALFGWVAWHSPGFDDEMFNIELIENLGTLGTVRLMQTEDVHPPGGYLINGLLFDVLRDWSAVRWVSAALYVLALCYLLTHVYRTMGMRAALLGWLLAGLAPAPLIWCTSLRWYAYFTPLLMWTLVLPRRVDGFWFDAKPAVAWLMLVHISYAALILLPTLWCWYGLHSQRTLAQYLKRAMWPWVIAGLLFLPQALIFISVHSKGADSQTGGLVKSIMGVAFSMASNQGLFPLSAAGLASMMGWLGFYALLGYAAWQRRAPAVGLLTVALGTGSFVVSGLASKFRNLVVLQPLLILMSAQARRLWAHTPYLASACCALILVGNATGLYNVVMHEDTSKNSWNLPVADIVQAIEDMRKACPDAPAVYGFDQVLARALRERHPDWSVVNYFGRFEPPPPAQAQCVITVYTFRGALTPERFQAFQKAEQASGGSLLQSVRIGHDRHAALKQKMDPDFPSYQAEIHLRRSHGSLAALNQWVRHTH